MLTVELNPAQVAKLQRAIEGTKRKLRKELHIAVNKTAKKVQGVVVNAIYQELATTKKQIRKVTAVHRAKTIYDPARVVVKKEKRLPLKAFKPRQTRKGVSYRISRTKGRKTVQGGFMGPRPGVTAPRLYGHAWKRKGKSRLPIQKLHAVSPWGVFVKRGMRGPVTIDGRKELIKQVDRRIRFITLKKQGTI